MFCGQHKRHSRFPRRQRRASHNRLAVQDRFQRATFETIICRRRARFVEEGEHEIDGFDEGIRDGASGRIGLKPRVAND